MSKPALWIVIIVTALACAFVAWPAGKTETEVAPAKPVGDAPAPEHRGEAPAVDAHPPPAQPAAPPAPVAVPPAPKSPAAPSMIFDMFDIPAQVTSVIIEVGSNVNGEFLAISRARPNTFYVAVEPLTAERTLNGCGGFTSLCTVLAGAVSNRRGWTTLRVAAATECSSILGGGTGCGAHVKSLVVPLLTADDIVDMIPRDLPVELMAFDCQGTDFYAASSLRRNRHRVANVILECQDLPLGDKLHIYASDKMKNCGQSLACIQDNWPDWTYGGCSANMDHVREWNCHFHNSKHPLMNPKMRHPSNPQMIRSIDHNMTCPLDQWNIQ